MYLGKFKFFCNHVQPTFALINQANTKLTSEPTDRLKTN